jgi:signal transduction histidine kinase/ActR/RegA family two-component response regulator
MPTSPHPVPDGHPPAFARSSELGNRISGHDWSATALGPATRWPSSLKTALRLILACPDPMAIYWGHDLVLLHNDAFRAILGSKYPACLGQPAEKVFPELWHLIHDDFRRVMREGKAVRYQDQQLPMVRRGYVEEGYFNYSFSPIEDENGDIAGTFVTATETTYSVLGERRTRTLDALAQRMAQSGDEATACDAAVAVLGADPADAVFVMVYRVHANGHAVLHGATGTGLEHHPGLCPGIIDLGAGPTGPWPLARACREGAIQVDGLASHLGHGPLGPWPERPHQAMVVPLRPAGSGSEVGFLILGLSPRLVLDAAYRSFCTVAGLHVSHAITNARTYQEERRRAEELAAIDRAKTTFFSNVSYEFRTPLTLMLGPLDEVLDPTVELPPGIRPVIEAIARNGRRLLRLVNTLLDFARIQAGREQAEYRPTDVAALTTDIVSAFRSATDRAGLFLNVDCVAPNEAVYIDHDMWEKIVLNLMSNAFKFTFTGGISIGLHEEGRQAVLTVQDSGVGIPAEELPRVFERFHRIEGTRARTHEGSGIGLALVQDLVALHGGTITVASVFGQGTTFRVALPLGKTHLDPDRIVDHLAPAEASPSAPALAEEAMRWLPETAVAEKHAAQARILVVDDNADMRAYFSRLLGRHWQVAAVADGAAALALAQADPPALVISDVMMPGLDGLSLIPALRRQTATAHVPVMLVSARAGTEASVDALKAGACDYLVKPFSPRELVARVAAQLERIAPTTGRMMPPEDRPALHDPERSFLKTHDMARSRLFSLLMQTPQSLAILRGRALVFEMANESYRRLTGSRPLIGRPLLEVFPDLDPTVQNLLKRVLDGERIVMDQLGITMDWEWTGTPYERFFSFIYEPILDDDHDAVIGVFVAANDVTELVRVRREAEKQSAREPEQAAELLVANGTLQATLAKLEVTNRDLARSNEDLANFAAIVSHDLQEPLRMIISYLQILVSNYETLFDTRAKTFFNYAIDGAFRMKSMITALLSYAQVGEAEIRLAPVAVGDVVADALNNLSTQVAERQVRVTVQTMPTVQADAALLTQLFQNLITNGIKYTLEGTPEIDVSVREDRETWAFTVADRGMGIDAVDQERIFQLFRRTAKATHLPGLGIGLATCKTIVERHGGAIGVQSAPGEGSRFTFTLPRVSVKNN